MSDSLRPNGLQPARLFCPWDFPGKNTGVGCHFLLQRIFPTQGSNLGLLCCRWVLYQSESLGKPRTRKVNATSLDPHINLLRQVGPLFWSLPCRGRSRGSNELEFVRDDPTSDGGQETWVFRLLGEERGSGGPGTHLVGAPDGRGSARLIFSQLGPWCLLNAKQTTGCYGSEFWFPPSLVSAASRTLRRRALKSIWSSFAKGESLSFHSWSPEVRDLIMLIMISASTAPNAISCVIS